MTMAIDEEDLFSEIMGSVDGAGEGRASTKFISSAPQPAVDKRAEEESRLREEQERQQRVAAAEQARLAEEQERQRQVAAAEQARLAKEQERQRQVAAAEQARLAEETRLAAEKELARQRAEEELRQRVAAETQAKAQKEQERARQEAAREAQNAQRLREEEAAKAKTEALQREAARKAEDARRREEELKAAKSPLGVKNVKVILKVADLYRSYEKADQEAIKLFMSEADEYELISKILNAPMATRKALVALVEAQSKSQVDRAFFLVGLENELLQDIGKVLEQVADHSFDTPAENKIEYCRRLESTISSLGKDEESKIQAIRDVFVAQISD